MTAFNVASRCGYEFLATRALAAQLRGLVEQKLARSDEPVVLYFTGVEVATGGFLDELVGKLVVEYGERVVLAGANEDLAETIGLVLDRRGIARATC